MVTIPLLLAGFAIRRKQSRFLWAIVGAVAFCFCCLIGWQASKSEADKTRSHVVRTEAPTQPDQGHWAIVTETPTTEAPKVNDVPSRPTSPGWIGIGSTKDDVLAVQGTPTETGSSIETESRLRPLKMGRLES